MKCILCNQEIPMGVFCENPKCVLANTGVDVTQPDTEKKDEDTPT